MASAPGIEAGNPTVEQIPGGDLVFRRIWKYCFKRDRIRPSAFNPDPGDLGVSVNWEKYSDARNTWQRSLNHGVAELEAWEVRAIEGLLLTHSPRPWNLAHADILGVDVERRAKLAKIARMVIPIGGGPGLMV